MIFDDRKSPDWDEIRKWTGSRADKVLDILLLISALSSLCFGLSQIIEKTNQVGIRWFIEVICAIFFAWSARCYTSRPSTILNEKGVPHLQSAESLKSRWLLCLAFSLAFAFDLAIYSAIKPEVVNTSLPTLRIILNQADYSENTMLSFANADQTVLASCDAVIAPHGATNGGRIPQESMFSLFMRKPESIAEYIVKDCYVDVIGYEDAPKCKAHQVVSAAIGESFKRPMGFVVEIVKHCHEPTAERPWRFNASAIRIPIDGTVGTTEVPWFSGKVSYRNNEWNEIRILVRSQFSGVYRIRPSLVVTSDFKRDYNLFREIAISQLMCLNISGLKVGDEVVRATLTETRLQLEEKADEPVPEQNGLQLPKADSTELTF